MIRYLRNNIHGSKTQYGMQGDKIQVLYLHGEVCVCCNSGELIPVAIAELVEIPVPSMPEFSQAVKDRKLSAKQQAEVNRAREMGVKI